MGDENPRDKNTVAEKYIKQFYRGQPRVCINTVRVAHKSAQLLQPLEQACDGQGAPVGPHSAELVETFGR